MRASPTLALLLALSAAPGACSPPEEPKGRPPSGATCGGFALPEACAACTASACCEQAAACRADQACAATYDCLAACPAGDQGCRGACGKGASAALSAMVACEAVGCAGKCGDTCGDSGLLLPTLVGRSSACAACLGSKACAITTTCASDSKCVDAATCALSCNPLDRGCLERCAARSTTGDLAAAARLACGAECDVGKQVACNGHVAWPRVLPGTTSVHVVLAVSGAANNKPVPGAEVRACGKVDVGCASPLAPPATTDARGVAEFDLSVTEVVGGFNGLFKITAAGYTPTLGFYNPPVASSMTLPPMPILRDIEFAAATAALGVSADPKRGHLIAILQDCELSYVSGATITISSADAGSTVGYFQAGFPTKDATATDGAGIAGGFNLPTGLVTVNAALDGKPIGSGQAFIEAQTITQVAVVPSP
ncbi:MAG: hypothetical protein IT374_19860 [Polyangiaceae bacterium]|nr:hypothetical protein [Polyangiaceae bacterium]